MNTIKSIVLGFLLYRGFLMMKIIVIDNIIREMKKQGITKGMGTLGSDPITIDLDNLSIGLGSDRFELARIPGTKGGRRFFSFVLLVAGGAENSISGICSMLAGIANKSISRH